MNTVFNIYNSQLRKTFLISFICIATTVVNAVANVYSFKVGTVTISLSSPLGQLTAVNPTISGALHSETGDVSFDVTVRDFQFITSFMPEEINQTTTKRFRDYYLETERLPMAYYKGKIIDLKNVNFNLDGIYPVETKGVITVHGVPQEIIRSATIIVKGSEIDFKTDFYLDLDLFNIRKPALLEKVFFKEVYVRAECRLKR